MRSLFRAIAKLKQSNGDFLAELKQLNEESAARLKEELKQELKQSNEESIARLKQSNEESTARLKHSRLKEELKQELKQSNEQSTARLKGELKKSTDRLQEHLNETSRELSDKIEASKVETLEEHIQESHEGKARMRNDITDLTKRLDNVNVLVVNEIEKNNDKLLDEFSMQTETVRR
ncbi:meiotically up-regulated gene 135 protein-like [Schistocerca americana]|uniref:meiotically up-regulated gene 135 protein-like n=1 Tax=Schistocerca americana TaxID=7009 RepID=UPI001F4F97BD|nr:meiotically up-regulated gene 135 protein-like [Schistocerca americana]